MSNNFGSLILHFVESSEIIGQRVFTSRSSRLILPPGHRPYMDITNLEKLNLKNLYFSVYKW